MEGAHILQPRKPGTKSVTLQSCLSPVFKSPPLWRSHWHTGDEGCSCQSLSHFTYTHINPHGYVLFFSPFYQCGSKKQKDLPKITQKIREKLELKSGSVVPLHCLSHPRYRIYLEFLGRKISLQTMTVFFFLPNLTISMMCFWMLLCWLFITVE